MRTIKCASENHYTPDEYNEFLQELGIEDETDSADGGASYIEFVHPVNEWNGLNTSDSAFIITGMDPKMNILAMNVYFKKNKMQREPYVNFGFWLAGEDGHGGHDVADLTKKEGICLDFDVQNQIVSIQLDMGDSLNAIVNGDLFAAEFSIDDFKDL